MSRHCDLTQATVDQLFSHVNQPGKQEVVRVELVRHEDEIVPAVFMRLPKGALGASVGAETPATVLIDVVTAFPFPTPLAFVMPVIFGDPREPFWRLAFLNLFETTTIRGMPLLVFDEGDLPPPRRLVRAFCGPRPRCGLVVFEDSALLMRRVVRFEEERRERLDEITEVMEFLDRFSIQKDYEEFQLAAEAFGRACAFLTTDPDGNALVVPPGRSMRLAGNLTFSLCVDNNRLIDRRAVRRGTQAPGSGPDIFISHAHSDAEAVRAVVRWLKAHWPDMRVSFTDATEKERFLADPGYFFDEARSARALLYLVTENSVTRPMVDTEVGMCAGKPIVSLVAGKLTLGDLAAKLSKSPFMSVDLEEAVELCRPGSARAVILAVARALGRDVPDEVLPMPDMPVELDEGGATDRDLAYLDDEQFIRKGYAKRQSEADAAGIVLELTRRALRGSGAEHIDVPQDPHDSLLTLLVSLNYREDLTLILDAVPGLMTQRLLTRLDEMVAKLARVGDHVAVDRLREVRPTLQHLVDYWERAAA